MLCFLLEKNFPNIRRWVFKYTQNYFFTLSFQSFKLHLIKWYAIFQNFVDKTGLLFYLIAFYDFWISFLNDKRFCAFNIWCSTRHLSTLVILDTIENRNLSVCYFLDNCDHHPLYSTAAAAQKNEEETVGGDLFLFK